jgi:hypothetical protein
MIHSQPRRQSIDQHSNLGLTEPVEQHKREGIDYARFIDRYLKFETHLLVRVRCRNGDERIACFQRHHFTGVGDNDSLLDLSGNGQSLPSVISNDLFSLTWRHRVGDWLDAHCEEKSVLVDVVQSIQHPQPAIPSIVWICRVDPLLRSLPHAVYFSSLSGFVFVPTVENGEAARSSFWGAPASLDQLPDEMVERTAEGLKGIASNGSEVRRDFRDGLGVINALAGFHIIFSPKLGWAFFAEGIEPRIELCEMRIGPLKLGEDLFVSGAHS